MKILAVSDQIIDRLYSTSVKDTYPDVRMVISCGDLPYEYLEFLVSVFNVPLLYVPGNHDPEHTVYHPGAMAFGCENVDRRVTFIKGLLFAGIGGSVMYHPNTPNQYTQGQVYQHVYRLLPAIYWQRIVHRRGLDVLVTHSPPEGIHDDDDPAHRGLSALNLLIRLARPRYMLHGHTIFYMQNLQDHVDEYYGCKIVNVYPFRIMNIE